MNQYRWRSRRIQSRLRGGSGGSELKGRSWRQTRFALEDVVRDPRRGWWDDKRPRCCVFLAGDEKPSSLGHAIELIDSPLLALPPHLPPLELRSPHP